MTITTFIQIAKSMLHTNSTIEYDIKTISESHFFIFSMDLYFTLKAF